MPQAALATPLLRAADRKSSFTNGNKNGDATMRRSDGMLGIVAGAAAAPATIPSMPSDRLIVASPFLLPLVKLDFRSAARRSGVASAACGMPIYSAFLTAFDTTSG